MKGLRALRSAAAAERFRFTARQHAVFMGLRRTQNTAAAAADPMSRRPAASCNRLPRRDTYRCYYNSMRLVRCRCYYS